MKTKKDPWAGIPNLRLRGPDRVCYVRLTINNEEHVRSLHINADPEGRNKRDVLDAIRAYKMEAAKNAHAILQLTRSRNETSTFATLFAAYRAACAERDIKAETCARNIGYLSFILRTVRGEFFAVETGRASLLTAELLETFEGERIARLKTRADAAYWTGEVLEHRMAATRNTIASAIRQARSLFSADLLRSRHYRALVLPVLDGFLDYRVESTSVAPFVRPPAEVWERILADLPTLKAAHPAQWIAFVLAVNCGLRRSSAAAARWAWFKELPTGDAEMEVRRAKGNRYFVRLSAAAWAELKAARTSVEYVIPSTLPPAPEGAVRTPAEISRLTEAANHEVIDAVVVWLRERGIDAYRPFHVLRKIFGDAVVRTHGLTEAQNALGHSKADLTHAIYSEHRSTKSVKVV